MVGVGPIDTPRCDTSKGFLFCTDQCGKKTDRTKSSNVSLFKMYKLEKEKKRLESERKESHHHNEQGLSPMAEGGGGTSGKYMYDMRYEVQRTIA